MLPDHAENYFQLFGFSPSFDIDTDAITTRYRDLQRTAHPDKFAHASAQERRLAGQHAANINEAFRVLKDPVQRALYLLQLHGITQDESQSTPLDAEFLMEQIELREAIGNARDNARNDQEIAKIRSTLDTWEQRLFRELKAAFAAHKPYALAQAALLTQKLRFFKRLRAELMELEDEGA